MWERVWEIENSQVMLTIAKLKTYQKFKGDAAAWKVETGGADSSGILDDDWLLIKDLVLLCRNHLISGASVKG